MAYFDNVKHDAIRIKCQHIRWDINLHLNCFRHFSLSIRLTITYVKYKGCVTFCKSHLNQSKRSSAITNWCILNPGVSNWILQNMIANEQIYCMVSIHRLLCIKFLFLNVYFTICTNFYKFKSHQMHFKHTHEWSLGQCDCWLLLIRHRKVPIECWA